MVGSISSLRNARQIAQFLDYLGLKVGPFITMEICWKAVMHKVVLKEDPGCCVGCLVPCWYRLYITAEVVCNDKDVFISSLQSFK